MPCDLCTEYEVTGGLKFVELPQKKLPHPSRRRSRLFKEVKIERAEHAAMVSETRARSDEPSLRSNYQAFKEIGRRK
jgi:hypothetical protein